ncbi:MAG: preprotein translocase subunit SecG [bacterium]|nr:preprotein translocase subunit SecG [bacterium]
MPAILYSIILALHILVCFGIVLIVLLQPGKGAGLSSAFGVGSGDSFFGGRGPLKFLEKLTTGCAIVFMLTCLSLSLFASKQRAGSVLDKLPVSTAPAVPAQQQSVPMNVPSPAPTQAPAPAVPTAP